MINRICLFLFAGFLLAGCSTVRVSEIYQSEQTDFGRYRTFSFYETSIDNATQRDVSSQNLDRIKAAAQRELEQRGLTRVESDADLLVNIGVTVEEKVQTRQTDIRDAPVYTGQRNYHWESEEVVVNQYEEGSVLLDLVDAEKNEMVWQGLAQGTITRNQEKMEKRINEAMDKLFEKYPR